MENTIKALKDVDEFHKNCLLLFDDLVSLIDEKTLADEVKNILLHKGYSVWNSQESEHIDVYIFEHNQQIRFVCMFVKVCEKDLKNNCNAYKQLCRKLKLNIKYPFILAYGIFKVRDKDKFEKDRYLKFNWVKNLVLINIPEDILDQLYHSEYKFNELLKLEANSKISSWYCNGAIFKIKLLFDIKNSSDIENLVNDLFKISL